MDLSFRIFVFEQAFNNTHHMADLLRSPLKKLGFLAGLMLQGESMRLIASENGASKIGKTQSPHSGISATDPETVARSGIEEVRVNCQD